MQEVYNEAKGKKKRYYTVVLAMLFGFLMIGLLAVILDFLLPYTIIILFPFVIMPYFLAMQMTLIQLDTQEFNRKNFYRMFALGISPLSRRAYSLLKNILLTLLIYFLALQAVTFVLGLMPQYSELMNEIKEAIAGSGTNFNDIYITINGYLQNNELLKNIIFISSSVAYGVSFMFFVYRILHNALYALCKVSASLPDGHNKPVFKEVFKKYSKDYYKVYYKNEWYKVALVPLFYIGGVVLAYFTGLLGLYVVFGAGFAFIAIIILLPNLMLYQEKTYARMFEDLSKANLSNMKKLYSDLKDQTNLTAEQEKALEDFMKQLENAVKNKEDSNNENKNSDD